MDVTAPTSETIDLRSSATWDHLDARATCDAAGVLSWYFDPPTPGVRALAEHRGRRTDDQLAGLPPEEVVRCANLLGWQVTEVRPIDDRGFHLLFRRLEPR